MTEIQLPRMHLCWVACGALFPLGPGSAATSGNRSIISTSDDWECANTMRVRTVVPTALVAGALVVGGVYSISRDGSNTPSTVSPIRTVADVAYVDASDHLPNTTAASWVTYADHVVVATAISEVTGEPSAVEIERGEGLIPRTVNFKVDDLIWSAERPAQSAPTTFELAAYGAIFSGGGIKSARPMALKGTPRLEEGHTYIIALVWDDERCPSGDARIPASWRTLGSGSVLPYDSATIGDGELAGRTQSAEETREQYKPNDPNTEFRASVVGKDVSALKIALDSAEPKQAESFRPDASCPA